MISKTIAKLALVSAVLIAPLAQAHAYSIHYQNGRYTVTCDNGDRWTVGDGSQQISHETAARICAKRGSSIMTNDGGNPVSGSGARTLQDRNSSSGR